MSHVLKIRAWASSFRGIMAVMPDKQLMRSNKVAEIESALADFPVVSIIGPRQCGKTTLAKQFASQKEEVHFYDLEDPNDYQRLENPLLELEGLTGYVIIDEVQTKPDLFPVLRVLADKAKAKFLILGSASPKLIQHSSESLAGRVYHLELSGFSLQLCGKENTTDLWLRGGFPLAFLASDDSQSLRWREEFIRTFLERDIPNLGIKVPARALRRFWMMLAHYHGQIFNASEIARSIDSSDQTARKYLDILTGTFMIRELQPWYYNTKKRLIKRPKVYFRDSGIFHALLSLENLSQLKTHPKLGASWEGFALEQAINQLGLRHEECFFWSLHSGAELDLVYNRDGKTYGMEFKYSDAPSLTPSMRSAMEELDLEAIQVVYPGQKSYFLGEKIKVSPLIEVK